jgi:hypothetical protein
MKHPLALAEYSGWKIAITLIRMVAVLDEKLWCPHKMLCPVAATSHEFPTLVTVLGISLTNPAVSKSAAI